MLMDAIQTELFGSMSWVLIPFFCIQQLSNTAEAVGMQVDRVKQFCKGLCMPDRCLPTLAKNRLQFKLNGSCSFSFNRRRMLSQT